MAKQLEPWRWNFRSSIERRDKILMNALIVFTIGKTRVTLVETEQKK